MPPDPAAARRTPAAPAGTSAGAPAGAEPGLRERKKEQTRRALRACAARLFAERGFAATTVAGIAAEANVSERTFFRYFDSKEALLLPDGAELFAYVEAALAARPPQEPPMTAVCNALLEAVEPFAASSLAVLARPLGSDEEALVVGQLRKAFTRLEDRLALLVRARLPEGTERPDLHAAVIACGALSAVRAVLRTARNHPGGNAGLTGPDLLRTAFAMLAAAGRE